jgi:hypothetical protein
MEQEAEEEPGRGKLSVSGRKDKTRDSKSKQTEIVEL